MKQFFWIILSGSGGIVNPWTWIKEFLINEWEIQKKKNEVWEKNYKAEVRWWYLRAHNKAKRYRAILKRAKQNKARAIRTVNLLSRIYAKQNLMNLYKEEFENYAADFTGALRFFMLVLLICVILILIIKLYVCINKTYFHTLYVKLVRKVNYYYKFHLTNKSQTCTGFLEEIKVLKPNIFLKIKRWILKVEILPRIKKIETKLLNYKFGRKLILNLNKITRPIKKLVEWSYANLESKYLSAKWHVVKTNDKLLRYLSEKQIFWLICAIAFFIFLILIVFYKYDFFHFKSRAHFIYCTLRLLKKLIKNGFLRCLRCEFNRKYFHAEQVDAHFWKFLFGVTILLHCALITITIEIIKHDLKKIDVYRKNYLTQKKLVEKHIKDFFEKKNK